MIERRFLDISLIVQGIANEPAENPAVGTQYIVGSSPTGAFANASANQIARYDGTNWKFTTQKAGKLEVFNASTGEFLNFNGSAWTVCLDFKNGSYESIAPVLDIIATGSTLPANCAEGDKFLKIDDAKIYAPLSGVVNVWNAGTRTPNGARYISSTDFKIYQSNGSKLTSSNIPNGGIFLNKADNYVYVYDETSSTLVKANADKIGQTITEVHTLTSEEISSKTFALSNCVMPGKEDSVLLFVCGILQVVDTDFRVIDNFDSKHYIFWLDKGLSRINLQAGDTCVIQYVKE